MTEQSSAPGSFRIGALAVLMAAFLSGTAAAQSPSDTSRRFTSPPVRVSSDIVDFGDIRPNQTVIRKATIHNDSENPIRIRGVRVSCGCTVADYPENWIEPGDSAEIELTFMSGDLWGPVQRYALLQFEGYNRPLRITTTAHVNTGIRASRNYQPLGQTLAGTLTLHSTDGTPFRVLSMSFAGPAADDDSADAAPGTKKTSELHEELDTPSLVQHVPFDFAQVNPDRLLRWVAVETDHPDAPVIAMHIDNPYAGVDRRRAMWAYSRDYLLLGTVTPGDMIEHQIGLRGLRNEMPVQRIEVESDLLDVEVLSTSMDPAEGMVLELRFTASAEASGLIHTRLTVRSLDYEDTIEVMLRVAEAKKPADTPLEADQGE
ncbi:MAG: DUF1573 domain-containing protein [Phycisphaerales bacterium]